MTEREVRRMYWNRRHYEEGAARQKAVEELIRQQSVLSNKCFAALQAATKAIEKQMEFVVPIKTPFIFDCEGRHYSHHENCLWSSTRRLTVEQWLGLISQVVNRESAKLASLSGRNAAPLDRRTAISTSVRTEVWRRDEGRCVRCGSRDRLEFDHIIPVALGGSNTSRNIELLCETCNRLKSASIG
ncbi:MAG: HNH endonuclease [Acidobacteriia bacterium]|nr:HNH endonuclease [Terriglobia bacterium]